MQETLPIKVFLAAHALCLQLLRLYKMSKPAVHLNLLHVKTHIHVYSKYVYKMKAITHQAVQVTHINIAGNKVIWDLCHMHTLLCRSSAPSGTVG